MSPIKVMLVDDHKIILQAFPSSLYDASSGQISVSLVADSAELALQKLQEAEIRNEMPQVALVDVTLREVFFKEPEEAQSATEADVLVRPEFEAKEEDESEPRIVDGVELTKLITERYKEVKVIMMSMHEEQEFRLQVERAGASGWVSKDDGFEQYIEAIKTVASGGTYFTPTRPQ